MNPVSDPRIRSPWGRIALAFGIFLFLANLVGMIYLLAVVPWDTGTPLDLTGLAKLLEEPRILAGLLTAQALAGVVTGVFMAMSVDRRPLVDLGVRDFRRESGALYWGLLLGVVSAAVVTLFISAVARRHVQLELFGGFAGVDLVLFALVVVGAAFMEEWLFRGYIYVNLREFYTPGRTVALSAFAFAMVHATNPGTSFLAWINIVLIGIVLGQLREITGGILMPLGLHIGWNLGLGMLFGVRVSGLHLPSAFHISLEDLSAPLGGGAFGPEASAVLTALFAGMAILLARRLTPPPAGALPPES